MSTLTNKCSVFSHLSNYSFNWKTLIIIKSRSTILIFVFFCIFFCNIFRFEKLYIYAETFYILLSQKIYIYRKTFSHNCLIAQRRKPQTHVYHSLTAGALGIYERSSEVLILNFVLDCTLLVGLVRFVDTSISGDDCSVPTIYLISK